MEIEYTKEVSKFDKLHSKRQSSVEHKGGVAIHQV